MKLQFQKAVRRQTKLRLGLVGPSGSGKTYTALRLAMALTQKRIAVIDTENGSAAKYAGEDFPEGLADFDVLELQEFEPKIYNAAIDAAVQSGEYDVLIIDGITPAWTAVKDIADNAARRAKGNSWAGWREATPAHNEFVDKLVKCPVHLIVTMRAKTEWVVDKDERTGKTSPRKIGLAPEQRAGMEYEFDVVGTMDWDNVLVIDKTRCSALAGRTFRNPGKDVANVLKAWLDSGDAEQPRPPQPAQQAQEQPKQQAPATQGLWWLAEQPTNDIGWLLAAWTVKNGKETRQRAIALANAAPPALKNELVGALRSIDGRAHCPGDLLREVFAKAWELGFNLETLGLQLGKRFGLPLKTASDLDADFAHKFLNRDKPQKQAETQAPAPEPALPPPGDGDHDPMSTVDDWTIPLGAAGVTLLGLAERLAATVQAGEEENELCKSAAENIDGDDPAARCLKALYIAVGLDRLSACPASAKDLFETFSAAMARGLSPSDLISAVDLLKATPKQLAAWRAA